LTTWSRNGSVRRIDSRLAAQSVAEQVQSAIERTKALEAPLVKDSDQGFRLQSANDDYRIRFGGLLQLNGRFFTSGDDKNGSNTFYVNKARPIISGTVAKYWEFQITPDFGQGKVRHLAFAATPPHLCYNGGSSK
jgi:hypothetical protein